MSPILNLVDRLLAAARRWQSLGRSGEALDVLRRLARFRSLPAATAEDVQASLAAIELKRRKYRQARRHLEAALAYEPDSARYHHMMATAYDADDQADPEDALRHYRRSLELDPDRADCLGEFGLLAVCLGHTEEGLRALRRAAELAPDDPSVIAKLLEGMCQADQPEQARHELRAALFRNGRDQRFQKLWSDFHFRQVRERQAAARRRRVSETDDGPVLLRFERPAAAAMVPGLRDRLIRSEPAHPLPPPRRPRPARLPRRHAQ